MYGGTPGAGFPALYKLDLSDFSTTSFSLDATVIDSGGDLHFSVISPDFQYVYMTAVNDPEKLLRLDTSNFTLSGVTSTQLNNTGVSESHVLYTDANIYTGTRVAAATEAYLEQVERPGMSFVRQSTPVTSGSINSIIINDAGTDIWHEGGGQDIYHFDLGEFDYTNRASPLQIGSPVTDGIRTGVYFGLVPTP
jgi:hypothetical protein